MSTSLPRGLGELPSPERHRFVDTKSSAILDHLYVGAIGGDSIHNYQRYEWPAESAGDPFTYIVWVAAEPTLGHASDFSRERRPPDIPDVKLKCTYPIRPLNLYRSTRRCSCPRFGAPW